MRKVFALLLIAAAVPCFAVPQMINYQGYLTDPEGTPLDTTVNMSFILYDELGDELWVEDHLGVVVTDGLFHVLLGSIEPIVADISGADRWLGIWVGSDVEMTPRQQIVSVPHAFRVGTVDGASGGTIGGDLTVSGKATIGISNTNSGSSAFVVGQFNRATGGNSTVTGGTNNEASNTYTTVGGGAYNVAAGTSSTVSGGRNNTARGGYSTVAGGGGSSAADSNSAGGSYSTTSGGRRNSASGSYSVTAGGYNNRATGSYATVGGGYLNVADTSYATVSGGGSHEANGYASTIGGGYNNAADTTYATVSGGYANAAEAYGCTVAGGVSNHAGATYTTISGGFSNRADSVNATVSGGYMNLATKPGATVGGGSYNFARGIYSVIAGGGSGYSLDSNSATGDHTVIGGGDRNLASGIYATIAGGSQNEATALAATVGGGAANVSSGIKSTISGGEWNTADEEGATVGGGRNNEAGYYATVPGGYGCHALGSYSLAAGRAAAANHDGCLVFADSKVHELVTWRDNQILMRASGGALIWSDSAHTTGVEMPPGAGYWANASDSAIKRDIRPVDPGQILDKVLSLPIRQWKYASEMSGAEHIGPMAQDFHAVFGLGGNPLTIPTVDPDGIALAAIQELAKQVSELRKENAAQQRQIQSLLARDGQTQLREEK